jgi:hypothetical protein
VVLRAETRRRPAAGAAGESRRSGGHRHCHRGGRYGGPLHAPVDGVEDTTAHTHHPRLVRRVEPPWTDWDVLRWEEKMRIVQSRQTVTRVLAGLMVVCSFVPMRMVAGIL